MTEEHVLCNRPDVSAPASESDFFTCKAGSFLRLTPAHQLQFLLSLRWYQRMSCRLPGIGKDQGRRWKWEKGLTDIPAGIRTRYPRPLVVSPYPEPFEPSWRFKIYLPRIRFNISNLQLGFEIIILTPSFPPEIRRCICYTAK